MNAGSAGRSFKSFLSRCTVQARIWGVMLSEASTTAGCAAPSKRITFSGFAIASTNRDNTIARSTGAQILIHSRAFHSDHAKTIAGIASK